MIVEDGLAPKCGTNLLRISILLITAVLSAEIDVECIVGWEPGLDEAVP